MGICKRTRNVRLGQSFFPAARRPWIGSIPQERFRGAFFCGETASFRPPLVNKDKALQTARCPKDQGQCWAGPMGWDRCCQAVVC
jgi:hypothetical protein